MTNGNVITDLKQVADAFNFFLLLTLVTLSKPNCRLQAKYLGQAQLHSKILIVTVDNVGRIIDNLKPITSSCVNSISINW